MVTAGRVCLAFLCPEGLFCAEGEAERGRNLKKRENFSCIFLLPVVFYHGDKGRSSAEKVGQYGRQTW